MSALGLEMPCRGIVLKEFQVQLLVGGMLGGRGAAAELEKKCEGLSQLKRLQVRGGGRGYWEGVWVGMPSTGDLETPWGWKCPVEV